MTQQPNPVVTGATPNPEPKPGIISVEILDENDNPAILPYTQYVNIKKDPKYIDNNSVLKSEKQMGKYIRCKVKYDMKGSHTFKIRLVPNPVNLLYTDGEKNGNPNFKYEESRDLEYTTDAASGEKIVEDLFLHSLGGNRFKVMATDVATNTSRFSTNEVKVERVMYYREAIMNGLTTYTGTTAKFEAEYAKHDIKFHKLSPLSIPHMMENIGSVSQQGRFHYYLNTEYQNLSENDKKMPYCIVVGYTGHLAVKGVDKRVPKPNIQVGVAIPVNIVIEDRSVNPFIQHPLWNDVVTGEDWFVECFFVKNGGNETTDKININKNKCTLVQNPGENPGHYDSVDVDVSGLSPETGTITLKVNWVEYMRGGFSFPLGINFIAVCTKAYWTQLTDDDQNKIIVHEVGHQLKMVPVGGGKLPDTPPNHYTLHGHNGNHCHIGLPLRHFVAGDESSAGCVMFGAVSSHIDFCVDCALAVKKLDLSDGV